MLSSIFSAAAAPNAQGGPRYHNSMTSSRSDDTLMTASYDVIKDPSLRKLTVPTNQNAAVAPRATPPSSHDQTVAEMDQETYEYIGVNKPVSASYANSGAITTEQAYEIDDSVYDDHNTGGEYDLEQPTHSVDNGTSNAVKPDDVYFNVVRKGDSHEFTAVAADVTTPNDTEEIYFKDNDAYEG